MFLKKLIYALFASGSLIAGESGWVDVKKKLEVEEFAWEEDAESWVLFYKTFGTERASARFPTDPTYTVRKESGDWVVRSEKEGQIYQMTVSKRLSQRPEGLPFVYTVETKEHIYQLASLQKEGFDRFVASFQVDFP